jgi:hypothetical protein
VEFCLVDDFCGRHDTEPDLFAAKCYQQERGESGEEMCEIEEKETMAVIRG